MKIAVFLGNPGSRYSNNRHNAGSLAGNYIAGKYNIIINQKNFSSLCGKGRISEIETLLLFPQTFMNNSGIAVREALNFHKEELSNIIVFHDEIELPFGDIRTKLAGGHKGHNGLRSIMENIQSPDFYRIRIGVGRPPNDRQGVANFLLSDFSTEELDKFITFCPVIEKCFLELLVK